MPPRQDDNKMVITSNRASKEFSPASHPILFELPKDISFIGVPHSPLPRSLRPEDVVRQRMAASLERASHRANDLQKRVDNIKAQCPVVHEACRSALVDEMNNVLSQASFLLEEAKREDRDVPWSTKNKRLSIALIHAMQYLDTLESAMAFSSRNRLEAGLLSVLDSIAANSRDDLEAEAALDVRVSSWNSPSLAFDFCVGRPAMMSLPTIQYEEQSLPLELEVSPIIEYTADELIRGPRRQAEAYSVKVTRCSHEKREYGARDGIMGEAMVKVHIEPLVESKTKKEVVWGIHNDVEPVRVKEVRATQQNAYPTKFRINFDMYTSTVYGQRGVTLTLALETCQTMDGKVPKVKIDLVVDP